MKKLTTVLCVLLLAGCGDEAATPAPLAPPEGDRIPVEKGIPDTQLGLAPGSLFEVAAPPRVRPNEDRPGGGELLGRLFEGAPPRIPHGIGEQLPLTLEDNLCLECHVAGSDEDGPALPESHLRDLRNAPDVLREQVAGARWVCTACHVPVTDAKPLPGMARGD